MAETSPLFQPYYLTADTPLLQERTIFVSFGYYFGLLCMLACIPLVFFMKRVKERDL
jgi:apolipoprotein N-acyltransferase